MTTRALLLRLFVSALIAPPAFAQAPAAASPTFDAVSIKPNKSGAGRMSISNDDDRYLAMNLSLKILILYAYDLQSQEQILGLPAWTNSVSFDIDARIDAETLATMKDASNEVKNHLRQQMMRAMLADRFQLKVHPETREMQVYDLGLAKGGSKLKPADPASRGDMSVSNRNITAAGISISSLCITLSNRLHRQVVDKTGLKGNFDFTLQWSPDEAGGESPSATGADQLPSLFTALQEQLGLKLDSTKGPVNTTVVDHVEMPSEN